MLTDLIFVFLIAILVGSLLMFLRLWRERQLIRGEYTQIPTFDTYDMESGQRKGGYRSNPPSSPNARSYGSNNGSPRQSKQKKNRSSGRRNSQREKPRSQPLRSPSSQRSDGHLSSLGRSNSINKTEVHISSSTVSTAAVRAATFCRNSSFYRWIDVLLPRWSRRTGKKQFFLVEYCPDASTEHRKHTKTGVNGFERKNGRIFRVVMSLIKVDGDTAKTLLERGNKQVWDDLILRLTSIRHPYLLPTWEIDIVSNRTVESTVLAFGNPFVQSGSLRDLIYRVDDPLVQKHSMYGRGGRPVKFKKMRIWGRQILEGLIALKEHGFTHIPLHSGNVMVLSDSAGSIV